MSDPNPDDILATLSKLHDDLKVTITHGFISEETMIALRYQARRIDALVNGIGPYRSPLDFLRLYHHLFDGDATVGKARFKVLEAAAAGGTLENETAKMVIATGKQPDGVLSGDQRTRLQALLTDAQFHSIQVTHAPTTTSDNSPTADQLAVIYKQLFTDEDDTGSGTPFAQLDVALFNNDTQAVNALFSALYNKASGASLQFTLTNAQQSALQAISKLKYSPVSAMDIADQVY